MSTDTFETVETARETGVALSVPSGALRHMLGVAPVFTGKDFPVALTGVRLEYEPGVFRVVSTDRYRLAVGELQGEHVTGSDVTPGGVSLPAKACTDIAKALPKGKREDNLPVSVLVSSDSVTVTVPGEWSRTVNTMYEQFPDYASLVKVPEGPAHPTFGVNPVYLADAAKLVTGKGQFMKWHVGGELKPMYGETTSPAGGTKVSWKYLLMQVKIGE